MVPSVDFGDPWLQSLQCSAYIEGVTPDGLKNLHGKGLEAVVAMSRSHSESHCDFSQF